MGRMVDRRGQSLVTAAAVLLTTVCLLALAVVEVAARAGLAALLIALAGLSTPPLEAGLRALWPVVLPDEARRRAALALDTGAQGLIYVTGPPLVAVLSTTTGPRTAMVVSASLGLVGAAVVLSAAPSRRWRPPRAAQRTGPLGPLAHAGLRWLFVAVSGVGFALGAMNVWAVALAEDLGMDLLSGLIPAALSAGSLVGGFLYGKRTWSGTVTEQLRRAALLFATGWLPLMAVTGPVSAVALTAVPGFLLTAVVTSAFLAVDAPRSGRHHDRGVRLADRRGGHRPSRRDRPVRRTDRAPINRCCSSRGRRRAYPHHPAHRPPAPRRPQRHRSATATTPRHTGSRRSLNTRYLQGNSLMAVVGAPGYQNVRKGEAGSTGAVRSALEQVGSRCPSFVVQRRTVDGLEAPGPPRLCPTLHRFPATTDRRSAMPEAPAEPFMTIRHTITGEITTTGYNAAARRILLQDGFEEAPSCACRATEPGTERAHGSARQPTSCSLPAIPRTWTEPSVGR
ncbi:MFS transporter [Streptomyces sp. NPDC006627]|uniref:MFS transporter n=1 Tax=Streptomyces sp. NPDC006627 TaxID=3154679 RepID=UPI0033BAD806